MEEGINLTQVIVAYAAPVFGFLGLLAQCYFSNRSKNDKKEQTETLSKQIKENTRLAKENHQLIEENTMLIHRLAERLTANDVTTVAVARQHIRQMYYSLRSHKQISDTDYRAITELYTAYKGVTLPDGTHPNSWCDHLYEEMCSWERVENYKHNNKEK